MTKYSISRRSLLGAAAASPFVLSGLGGPAAAAGITVGIIYVGSRQDYGWNQAHVVAARQIAKLDGASAVALPYPYWHQRQTERNPPPG